MMDVNKPNGRGQVTVLRTRPETVLQDYDRLMHLANYQAHLSPAATTLLKPSLTWQIWFPAASTEPWQLDGVIRTLLRDGFTREQILLAYDNNTTLDETAAARSNRYHLIQEHYGIRDLYSSDSSIEWVEYRPKQRLAVLNQLFPDGIFVPRGFIGTNLINLPTMKTDASALLAGAMLNSFGALLDERRKQARPQLHDVLVDLLQIQQDIHSGIFCVMDGTFAGEGPGPRALRPYIKNTLLASSDPVALDAVAAKMMGIDPMRIRSIRHAHERGLGVGAPREIQILGDTELARENWRFEHDADTLASWGKKQYYNGSLEPLQEPVENSPLAPLPNAAAYIYYNWFWYPFVGHKRAEMMLNSAWGQKYLQYSEGMPFNPNAASKKPMLALAAAGVGVIAAIGLGAYLSNRKQNT